MDMPNGSILRMLTAFHFVKSINQSIIFGKCKKISKK